MPTQAAKRNTTPAAGAQRARRRAPSDERSSTQTLERVRQILHETCVADGQGTNLQEVSRRKSYRVGINRALAEIAAFQRDR